MTWFKVNSNYWIFEWTLQSLRHSSVRKWKSRHAAITYIYLRGHLWTCRTHGFFIWALKHKKPSVKICKINNHQFSTDIVRQPTLQPFKDEKCFFMRDRAKLLHFNYKPAFNCKLGPEMYDRTVIWRFIEIFLLFGSVLKKFQLAMAAFDISKFSYRCLRRKQSTNKLFLLIYCKLKLLNQSRWTSKINILLIKLFRYVIPTYTFFIFMWLRIKIL